MLVPLEAGSGLYSGGKSSRKVSCSVDNVREVVLRIPEDTQAPAFLLTLTAPHHHPENYIMTSSLSSGPISVINVLV